MDAIYVICIACHVSCKPSGTKSLEAFFILSATLALVGTRSLVGGIVDGERRQNLGWQPIAEKLRTATDMAAATVAVMMMIDNDSDDDDDDDDDDDNDDDDYCHVIIIMI